MICIIQAAPAKLYNGSWAQQYIGSRGVDTWGAIQRKNLFSRV